jgi:hypothetical protein
VEGGLCLLQGTKVLLEKYARRVLLRGAVAGTGDSKIFEAVGFPTAGWEDHLLRAPLNFVQRWAHAPRRATVKPVYDDKATMYSRFCSCATRRPLQRTFRAPSALRCVPRFSTAWPWLHRPRRSGRARASMSSRCTPTSHAAVRMFGQAYATTKRKHAAAYQRDQKATHITTPQAVSDAEKRYLSNARHNGVQTAVSVTHQPPQWRMLWAYSRRRTPL